MKIYITKASQLPGSDFREIHNQAFAVYKQIKQKTKRRVYVRSIYFNKEKIFLDLFWQHLFQKQNWRDRVRRLKFFPCALELLQYSRFDPLTKDNPNRQSESLHRFFGITKNGDKFIVQIKEDKRNRQKFLISVFPESKKTSR